MHIIIVGNGVAGVTAARYIRKHSDHEITIISAETSYFFSRTALMYVFMGHMRFQDIKPYEDGFWAKNRINLVQSYVSGLDSHSKTITLSSNRIIHYDKLILATGSVYNKFAWPGEDLEGVQGLYSYQDLQLLEQNVKTTRKAVIVGGGLIGIEMGEMLASRGVEVSFLVREESYWSNILPFEESQMVGRQIRAHHFDLKLQTELQEILPDEQGHVRAVVTSSGEEISCQLVGLTAGVKPNIGLAKSSGIIDCDKGILVNEYLETNVEDIYAVGDCVQHIVAAEGRKPIEQVWYTGKIMGRTVASSICGNKEKYHPGIWFNSAKFLDLEYQVYGNVPNLIKEPLQSLFWEHEMGMKSIRIVYHGKENNRVIGFNLMGIRYRHEVCVRWIREKRSLDYVVNHLADANFDPEFFTHHEKELKKAFETKLQGQYITELSDSQHSSNV